MMSKQQKNPVEISESLGGLFHFLEASGIKWRVIEQGDDAGMWLPLASTLRKRRYAGRDSAALDCSNIKRMLIDGRVQAAIDVNDFALYFAPQCQEPAVQGFGVDYLNTFVAPIYKTGRPDIAPEPTDVDTILRHMEVKGAHISHANSQHPGAGNLLSLPGSKFVMDNGRLTIGTSDFDLSTVEGIVDAFLSVHPEWSNDVIEHPELGRTMTVQLCLATSRFLSEWGAGDADNHVKVQEALVQYILDNCNGEFGPASTRKKSRKRKK